MPTSKPRYIDNVSMGADITGDWLLIDKFSLITFHASWGAGGTPVGAFVFETTEDGDTNRENPQPTENLDPVEETLPAGASDYFPGGASDNGTFKITFKSQGSRWIRASYDRTSGTSSSTLKMGVTMKAV